MSKYIELSDELILAANAGARVIENTKRYHGASYCVGLFADIRKEIPYLKAAQVLREIDAAPTIDAVPVVRCKDCKYRSGLNGRAPFMFYTCTCAEGLSGAVRDSNFCSYGERRDDNELC